MIRKTLFYLALAFVFIVSVYFARLPLIKFTVNSLLLDTGIELTQLERLVWHRHGISIGHLVLVIGDEQKELSLFDLYLGFSGITKQQSTLSIKKILINLPSNYPEPQTEKVLSLKQIVSQINTLPIAGVSIDELISTFSPDPLRIRWEKHAYSQSLLINDTHTLLDITLDLKQPLDIQGTIVISVDKNTALAPIAELTTTLTLSTHEHPLSITGDVNLQKVLPWLHNYITVSDKLVNLTGSLSFSGQGFVNDPLNQFKQAINFAEHSRINAVLDSAQKRVNNFHLELQAPTNITVQANKNLLLSIEDGLFSVKNEQLSLNAHGKLPFVKCQQLSNNKIPVDCSGSITTNIDSALFNVQQWQFENNNLQVLAEFTLNEQLLDLSIKPGTLLKSSTIHFGDTTIENIQIVPEGVFTTQVTFPFTFYSLYADSIQVMLPKLQHSDMTLATRLTLSDINYSAAKESDAFFNLNADSVNIQVAEQWMPAFALQSHVTLQQSLLTQRGQIKTDRQQLLLDFTLQHDVELHNGSAKLDSNTVSVNTSAPLSQYFSSWPFDWDVQQGKLFADASLKWQGGTVTGHVSQQLQNISGQYLNTAVIGLNALIKTKLFSLEHFSNSQPITIDVASVDIGIPITHIQAQLGFDSLNQQLDINHLEAQLLGGKVVADKASYTLGQTGSVDLIVEGLDVKQALSLSGYDPVQGDGRISGTLPILISKGIMTIDQGRLAAEAPGGIIVYKPLTPSSNPSMLWLDKALSNYHYDTLEAKVHYDKHGDLDLNMAMRGNNPDLNQGQAVNLNVNVSDNIPTLLRSLQASRTVADIVERKLESSQ